MQIYEKDFLLSDFGITTVKDRYLSEGETSPQDMFARVAKAYGDDEEHAKRLYQYMSDLWFIPATPVLSNGGTGKALPISCFLNRTTDDLKSITDLWVENVWLASSGGGIGSYWGDVRAIGEKVGRVGESSGIIPFIKVMDSLTLAISQGSLRRGSAAVYLPMDHPEIVEFLDLRKPTGGDPNRKALNLHNAVVIKDQFMYAVLEGKNWELKSPKTRQVVKTVPARDLWAKLLEARLATGEPYIMFMTAANRARTEWHKQANLNIVQSNLCCVTGDQRVATSKGLVTVKELYDNPSEEPIIVQGSNGPTTASPMQLYAPNNIILEIKTKEGYSHKVTPEHKVSTQRGLVEAKDLLPGDLLNLQPSKGMFGQVNKPIEALICGLIAADGTFGGKEFDAACIDLWIPKTSWLKDTLESNISYILQGEKYKTNGTSTPIFKPYNETKYRMSSKVLARYLARLGFTKETKLRVPEFVWQGTEETVKEYLRGVYIADGHIEHGSSRCAVSLGSNNYVFLQQLQLLWLNLGIKSTIYKLLDGGDKLLPDGRGGHKYYKTKPSWRLFIQSLEMCREAEVILELAKYRNSDTSAKFLAALENGKGYRSKMIATVSEVNQIPNEDAYCLTVKANDHLWVVNGILTHNSEIFLPTSESRTAVCCLSSLNFETYDQWKDNEQFIFDVFCFLDNVLQDFIDRAPTTMQRAKFSAMRERSVGLGVMGFHSYLQKNLIPFESVVAKSINTRAFRWIREQADSASRKLAALRGACPDAEEFGFNERFSYKLAVAPTASISVIGNTSPSIEPWSTNYFVQKTLSGTFAVRNPHLKNLLAAQGRDTQEVWDSILKNHGSVQHLDFLMDLEKDVFKTAFELDQRWVLQHAIDRQPYICQGQSLNLFLYGDVQKKYLNDLHIKAWEGGLKGLYYVRSTSIKTIDNSGGSTEDCLACQ